MEIITLLKANIRRRKGSFWGIAILMFIISMAFTAFLSMQKSCRESIDHALTYADAPNISVYTYDMSEELMTTLKDHEMVERVEQVTVAETFFEYEGEKDGNSFFLQKYDSTKYRRLTDDCSGYSGLTEKPEKGGIFVSQGFLTRSGARLGDTLDIYTDYYNAAEKPTVSLKITGIVTEPVNGCSLMGWKQGFVSDEDYEMLLEACGEECYIVKLYKATDCPLNDRKFRRQLNLDTGIIDKAMGSMTREESLYYTNLFPQIILSILLVFLVFLMIVVLIVMRHSISTSIEIDYVNLGILKAMGFSGRKIRAVFMLQYLLAQAAGALPGFLLAIPAAKLFGDVFQPITAIPGENRIAGLQSSLILAGVLLVSGLFILLSTRRIGLLSPVRAISGGRNEIYFDSRLRAPVSKRFLSASLALRQFTANKRRYVGIIIIATMLVFFMLTVTGLGDSINSKAANEAMGVIYTEVELTLKDTEEYEAKEREIDAVIEKYAEIEKKYRITCEYISLDGENVFCFIYKNPEVVTPIKGRTALYDNEIMITELLSDELGIHIGDTVTVSKGDHKADFIVTGFFQGTSDTGRCFLMNLDGVRRMGFEDATVDWAGYSISDPSHCEEIKQELNEAYGDILDCSVADKNVELNIYDMAVNALKAVIYSFSVLFAFVVVVMVCKKCFQQEKTDLGIYQAVGFRIRRLRLQFAVRFLIMALISSVFGSVLSLLFSEKTLTLFLRKIGIASFPVAFSVSTFVLPVSLICICFFVFAYLVSRRIRTVDLKELITE
ncbi:MAG: ABC transporter permease [Lachnospiraceae bacterium]|nr:ABC transporter permease [Lachnospiraceae bacterium]